LAFNSKEGLEQTLRDITKDAVPPCHILLPSQLITVHLLSFSLVFHSVLLCLPGSPVDFVLVFSPVLNAEARPLSVLRSLGKDEV